jgi:hypothetical protein
MEQAFALKAAAHSALNHEVDSGLFQDAGANALDHVILGAVFDDDGVDADMCNRWPNIKPAGPAPAIPT